MSLDFTSIQPDTWQGAVTSIPVTLSGVNAKTVPVLIEWNDYTRALNQSGVTINLAGVQPALQLPKIASVFIDNTNCPSSIFVYFPDTGFTAPCAAYSSAWVPVVTNQLKAAVFAIGFLPTLASVTRVFFCNVFVPYANNVMPPLHQGTWIELISGPNGNRLLPSSISYSVTVGIGDFLLRKYLLLTGFMGPSTVSRTITSITYDDGSGPVAMTLLGASLASANANAVAISRVGIIKATNAPSATFTITMNGGVSVFGGYALHALHSPGTMLPNNTVEQNVINQNNDTNIIPIYNGGAIFNASTLTSGAGIDPALLITGISQDTSPAGFPLFTGSASTDADNAAHGITETANGFPLINFSQFRSYSWKPPAS